MHPEGGERPEGRDDAPRGLPGGPDLPAEARWVVERPPSEVGNRLRRVMSLSARIRQVLAHRLGVGPSEFSAMEHLMAEPMGPVELSRRLDLTSAAATVLLHRLEGSGHVERRPHPTDRRRQLVVPRAQGTAAVFRELRPLVERLDRVTAGFDARDQEVIARYLAGVADAIEATIAEDGGAGQHGGSAEPQGAGDPPAGVSPG